MTVGGGATTPCADTTGRMPAFVQTGLFRTPGAVRFETVSTWDPGLRAAIRRHYTGSRGAPPGRKLGWLIIEDDRAVGWIGLGEPAYKLAPRRRLGLADIRPLPATTCCFIYRLEGPRQASAGDILRAWHPVAADGWEARYGERPVHWETMVGQGDTANLGACFRRAGWRPLGWTTGRGAIRPPGATHSARIWVDRPPKLVLYRGPLARLPASTTRMEAGR